MPDPQLERDDLRIDRPPATLREIALERLRAAIVEGRFTPGERLVERRLCARLCVSRSVVREALRHLEAEGLVATVPNQGPVVAVIDSDRARQIYEIRTLLESDAAAACAQIAESGTLAALDAALAALSAANAVDDMAAALRATSRFYETLFAASGKQVAWEITQRLNGQIGRLRAMTLGSEGRRVAGLARLREIQAAIARHDARAAAAACRRHLGEASRIAQRLLDQNGAAETSTLRPRAASPLAPHAESRSHRSDDGS